MPALAGTLQCTRSPPELINSASSVSSGEVGDRWLLGNAHNFDSFVCAAGLFAGDKLSKAQRQLFSPGLRQFALDPHTVFDLAKAAGARACARHASFLT